MVRTERDNELPGVIVGVRPTDGEDVVRFVVVVCSCEWLLKAAIYGRLWLWRRGGETK